MIFKELAAFVRFFAVPKQKRPLVFYSESGAYYRYFEPYLEELFKQRPDLNVHYISSDPRDVCFKVRHPRLKTHCVRSFLPFLIQFLDSAVLVMTMPDLGRFHVRRSIRGAHHVYIFHAMVSSHMIYRTAAFRNYDTIFCVGPHHVQELKKARALCGGPDTKLVEAGYPLLEKIHHDHGHLAAQKKSVPGSTRVLIAPSWGRDNILESCAEQLIAVLADAGFEVVVRPHPEFAKRFPEKFSALRERFKASVKVSFETEQVTADSLHTADVLVTDWSGVAMEYALGTERPVLFINTPRKVMNPEYERLGIEPIEARIRNQIGEALEPGELARAPEAIRRLLVSRERFAPVLRAMRDRVVYRFGESARWGAAEILKIVDNYRQ